MQLFKNGKCFKRLYVCRKKELFSYNLMNYLWPCYGLAME